MGLSAKLIFAILVIGAGSGFQHGYNIGVCNCPANLIKAWMRKVFTDRGQVVTEDFMITYWGFAVSVYCVGGALGGGMSSLFASNLGRRGALLVNCFFAMISGACMFAAKYVNLPELFVVGRFITGYNCGIHSGICCTYLVEISTTNMRGAIGTVYQLIITVSICFAQVIGMQCILGNEKGWPFLFLIVAIGSICQFVLLPFCPESPKYIYCKKGEEPCRRVLQWLRGGDVGDELESIKKEAATEEAIGRATYKQMFSQSLLRKPLIVSIMVMLAQQLSGINAVMFYSTQTFEGSGFSTVQAQLATLCVGVMNVLMTIVSLILVDISGRKTLLLAGFIFMIITTLLLTVSLMFAQKYFAALVATVVLVVLYVVGFATGPGSIPWFLVAEFFTQSARPLAASMASATNWIGNLIVGLCFPPIQQNLGPFVFIIFVVFQALFIIYIAVCVPETKGKEYEEVMAFFQ